MKIEIDGELLKDRNVRFILEKIHNKLRINSELPELVQARVHSYDGNAKSFRKSQRTYDDYSNFSNEEILVGYLRSRNAIDLVRYDVLDNDDLYFRNYVDDSLNSPGEFITPFVVVWFRIADKEFLKNLCDITADITNSNRFYSLNDQRDIVFSDINFLKSRVKHDDLSLSWANIEEEDAREIQIVSTLKSLNQSGLITVKNIDYNLLEVLEDGRIKFWADITCKAPSFVTSNNTLRFKSLTLDVTNETAYYPRVGLIGFDVRDGRKIMYEVLKAFVEKESAHQVLSDLGIWKILRPHDRKTKEVKFSQLDQISNVVHHLNEKFKKNDFIKRDKANKQYRLNP